MVTEKNKKIKQTRAFLKNLPITPRKVRLATALMRNRSITEAVNILENTNKKAALPLVKLLNSAIANATNNHKMNFNRLTIKTVCVNEGRKLKRFRPRAKGATYPVWKRASHVEIVLMEEATKTTRVVKEVANGAKN